MNIAKVNFQEGKARVLNMVNDMYCDIAHDHIFHLKNMDIKTELTDVGYIASHLVDTISEYKQIVNDTNKCESFADIMDLTNKHAIFEGCEEIVVGAFLDISVDIYDGEF